jgi:hypothetical protein
MKIAVFGDIHGNIEALTSSYSAVQLLMPDKVYHLGDLGGYSPFVGSVGKPKDDDPRACVTMITIAPNKVNVEFLRVPYDAQKTADVIVASGLPRYFADRLKEAR